MVSSILTFMPQIHILEISKPRNRCALKLLDSGRVQVQWEKPLMNHSRRDRERIFVTYIEWRNRIVQEWVDKTGRASVCVVPMPTDHLLNVSMFTPGKEPVVEIRPPRT